ncbi:hemin-degrading factor [Olivibacter sitiensis]|uniref:hemin-degrading factor n=1 Tax=Olivibacter sitiensis TaxID=376470 RepID=UPI0004054355|nr:hemin-degrading factor [Olivibacter sitiensis]
MENNVMTSLKERYEHFKAENPKVRIRDAAKQLGVSEAELVALTAIRLQDDIEAILKDIPQLGYVMALTRNDYAVHERKGEYRKVAINGGIGLVVNPDIDLRLFLGVWKYVFAVSENERQSIQFFGKEGDAIHKVYLQEESNTAAYDELVARYKSPVQGLAPIEEHYPEREEELPDSEIDVKSFQDAWVALQDTHDFHAMLKAHHVKRTQAMRLAPKGYVTEISVAQVKQIMELAAAKEVEIMVFIGNRGCIQIHTGQVNRLLQTGPWFNVLDPTFNMHLREDAIAHAWMVRKPTKDGVVTSIECYDALGDTIVQFFGKRKPGIPELAAWREIVEEVLA